MTASMAQAEPKVHEATQHTHDGFYLRIGAGPEYSRPVAGDAQLMNSTAVSLGWSVSPSTALFFGSRTAARIKLLGDSAESGADSRGLALMEFQLGTSYYRDNNVHFTASYGRGFYYDGTTTTKSCGFFCGGDKDPRTIHNKAEYNAINAAVGKEWWTSDNWGGGVALHGSLLSFEDNRIDGPGLSVGLRVTGTYN